MASDITLTRASTNGSVTPAIALTRATATSSVKIVEINGKPCLVSIVSSERGKTDRYLAATDDHWNNIALSVQKVFHANQEAAKTAVVANTPNRTYTCLAQVSQEKILIPLNNTSAITYQRNGASESLEEEALHHLTGHSHPIEHFKHDHLQQLKDAVTNTPCTAYQRAAGSDEALADEKALMVQSQPHLASLYDSEKTALPDDAISFFKDHLATKYDFSVQTPVTTSTIDSLTFPQQKTLTAIEFKDRSVAHIFVDTRTKEAFIYYPNGFNPVQPECATILEKLKQQKPNLSIHFNKEKTTKKDYHESRELIIFLDTLLASGNRKKTFKNFFKTFSSKEALTQACLSLSKSIQTKHLEKIEKLQTLGITPIPLPTPTLTLTRVEPDGISVISDDEFFDAVNTP